MREMNYAMRVLHLFNLEADVDWVSVVEHVIELMTEDGTFATSPADSDSNANNSGLALDTIALALSFMDEDTKDSVRDLVAGAADAVKTLLAAAEDKAGDAAASTAHAAAKEHADKLNKAAAASSRGGRCLIRALSDAASNCSFLSLPTLHCRRLYSEQRHTHKYTRTHVHT